MPLPNNKIQKIDLTWKTVNFGLFSFLYQRLFPWQLSQINSIRRFRWTWRLLSQQLSCEKLTWGTICIILDHQGKNEKDKKQCWNSFRIKLQIRTCFPYEGRLKNRGVPFIGRGHSHGCLDFAWIVEKNSVYRSCRWFKCLSFWRQRSWKVNRRTPRRQCFLSK